MINEEEKFDSQSAFEDEMGKFKDILIRSKAISMVIGSGRELAMGLAWATWVFTRMCVIGDSIVLVSKYKNLQYQTKVFTLDCYSIANMARAVIKSSIMLHYLAEPNENEDEWLIKKRELDLHDCTSRYRMFKNINSAKHDDEQNTKLKTFSAEQAAGFKALIAELRLKLKSHHLFGRYSKEQKERLLSGQEIYIGGLRSAVRKAGWDVDEFDSVYVYLSSQSHTSPMSFYRIDDHGIHFDQPSEFQFGLAGYSLGYANYALRSAAEMFTTVFPEVKEVWDYPLP